MAHIPLLYNPIPYKPYLQPNLVVPPTPSQLIPPLRPSFPSNTQNKNQSYYNVDHLPPLPMLFAKIYKHLLNIHQVALMLINPVQPPYTKCYDAKAKYDYHVVVVGHSIENYLAFKNKFSPLIKHGWISFDRPNGSLNINSNPLPTHTGVFSSTVNIIRNEESIKLLELYEIKVLMRELFDALIKARYFKLILSSHCGLLRDGRVCEYHPNATRHTIKECEEF